MYLRPMTSTETPALDRLDARTRELEAARDRFDALIARAKRHPLTGQAEETPAITEAREALGKALALHAAEKVTGRRARAIEEAMLDQDEEG